MGHSHKAGWRIQKEVKAGLGSLTQDSYLFPVLVPADYTVQAMGHRSSSSYLILLNSQVFTLSWGFETCLSAPAEIQIPPVPEGITAFSLTTSIAYLLVLLLFQTAWLNVRDEPVSKSDKVSFCGRIFLWTSSSQKQHRYFLLIMKAWLTALLVP